MKRNKKKSKKKITRRKRKTISGLNRKTVDKLLSSVSQKYIPITVGELREELMPGGHPMCRCMAGDVVTFKGQPIGVAKTGGRAGDQVEVQLSGAETMKLPVGRYEINGCGGGGSGGTEDKYRPSYYGGEADPYEPFKVIRAWGCNFFTGNALKYIRRAGKKDGNTALDDLKKARTYLDSEIAELESK